MYLPLSLQINCAHRATDWLRQCWEIILLWLFSMSTKRKTTLRILSYHLNHFGYSPISIRCITFVIRCTRNGHRLFTMCHFFSICMNERRIEKENQPSCITERNWVTFDDKFTRSTLHLCKTIFNLIFNFWWNFKVHQLS